MTREEERYVIEMFKEQYFNIPMGEIKQMAPPWTDFLLTTNSGIKIGIELTQAVHSKKAKQYSSENKRFTDLVLAELTPLLPFHFSISVSLDKGVGIPKSERNQIAIQVANFCKKEFFMMHNNKHEKVEHVNIELNLAQPIVQEQCRIMGYRNLPKGVKSISITRFDDHGSSFNSCSEASAIPTFTKDRLDEHLLEKERKLALYNQCDEYWLIIWQGGGITGYFQESEIKTPIQSKFDKVFIVRTMGKLITLKA